MKKGIFWSIVLFLAMVAGAATALALYFHNRVKYLEDDLGYGDDFYDDFQETDYLTADDENDDSDDEENQTGSLADDEDSIWGSSEDILQNENWAELNEDSSEK